MSEKALRDGLLEALRLASSAESQLAYAKRIPIADVVAEVFCGWEDLYSPDSAVHERAFSTEERSALATFDVLLTSVSTRIPGGMHLPEFQASSEWRELASAACTAIEAFEGAYHEATSPDTADPTDGEAASERSVDAPGQRGDTEEILEYDESAELDRYVWDCYSDLFTDFERQVRRAHQAELKASHSSEPQSRMIRTHFGAKGNPDVMRALERGWAGFRSASRERVMREHPQAIIVNRCPA